MHKEVVRREVLTLLRDLVDFRTLRWCVCRLLEWTNIQTNTYIHQRVCVGCCSGFTGGPTRDVPAWPWQVSQREGSPDEAILDEGRPRGASCPLERGDRTPPCSEPALPTPTAQLRTRSRCVNARLLRPRDLTQAQPVTQAAGRLAGPFPGAGAGARGAGRRSSSF